MGGVVEIALGGLAEQEVVRSTGGVCRRSTVDGRRKKRIERDECKGVRMTLYSFGRGANNRSLAVKNAKCEVHFVPNKKAAPQFAFANEEPLIEVRCKMHPQSAFFYRMGVPIKPLCTRKVTATVIIAYNSGNTARRRVLPITS